MTRRESSFDPQTVPTHNVVTLESGLVVVRNRGDAGLLNAEGTRCRNPDADEGMRVYEKRFLNGNIVLGNNVDLGALEHPFLPDEERGRIATLIRPTDLSVTFGVTGYSELKDPFRELHGIEAGAYERICFDMVCYVLKGLRDRYPQVKLVLTNGASNYGIDGVAISAADQLGISKVGFNQPDWLFWVQDDGMPLYVAANKLIYHVAFADSTDIMLDLGGRADALFHDDINAQRFDKTVIASHALKFICKKDVPPGRDPDDPKIVHDASRAFLDTHPRLAQHSDSLTTLQELYDSALSEAIDHIERKVLKRREPSAVQVPNEFNLSGESFSPRP